MGDYIFRYVNPSGEEVVMVAEDGEVTFGVGFTTMQEAAKEFWYCVGDIQRQILEGKIEDDKPVVN